jgi:hypothetical protein
VRSRTYRVYGLKLCSAVALPCPRIAGPADVTLSIRPRSRRPRSDLEPADWFRCRRLDDNTTHLEWRDLFEFLVSADGRRIESHRCTGASQEILLDYLLSQVLSFSLLAFGREPLHASAVTVPGGVAAFLGDCGAGKSSLSAAFLRHGHRIVTDDVLVLERRRGRYFVDPGMPRIKLFPHVARRVLGVDPNGVRMNPGTAKQVLGLPPRRVASRRLPLLALYLLPRLTRGRRASGRTGIARLAPSRAVLEIVRASFNTMVTDRARLARQFRFASDLAARVPVSRLAVPRRLASLSRVREAILTDLAVNRST